MVSSKLQGISGRAKFFPILGALFKKNNIKCRALEGVYASEGTWSLSFLSWQDNLSSTSVQGPADFSSLPPVGPENCLLHT